MVVQTISKYFVKAITGKSIKSYKALNNICLLIIIVFKKQNNAYKPSFDKN